MLQSDMVTGVHRTQHRRRLMTTLNTKDQTTYPDYDGRFRPPTPPEMTDPYEHLLDDITTLTSRIHTNNPRLLQMQVPRFRGMKDNFNEFEHLLKNHLRPMNHRLTEAAKIQYFRSLLREEAIEFYQSQTISTETNLNDLLTKFQIEFTKDDLKEVARYKWDQAKNDPFAEKFSDFLKHYHQTSIPKEVRPVHPNFPPRKAANIDPAGANEQQQGGC